MASADTLVAVGALNAEPPSSNFATFDTRNGTPVLDFDPATDESIEFGLVMPRSYAGGGLTVTIGWMSSSDTSGNVRWDMAFKSFTDGVDDMDTKAFASVNSITAAAATPTGAIYYDTITFTDGADMDSVAAGEYFRIILTRDANHATDDTLSSDVELVFIEIKET